MKLKFQFALFILTLLGLILVLAFLVKEVHPWVFVAAEVLVVLSVIFSIIGYQKISKQVKLISTGIHFLQSNDFNTKLAKTGQKDIDQLIATYNTMMERLRMERITLQEKQNLLFHVMEASPSGILLLNYEHKVTYINGAIETLIGKEGPVVVGRQLSEIFGDRIGEELLFIKSGESRVVTLSGVQKIRFRKSHFIDQGIKTHFFLLEELTREMLATERNAFEKVIRMMAHEVNNSVGPINSILQSIIDAQPNINQKDWGDYAKVLQVAVERNLHLAGFMSNFSKVVKIPKPNPERIDLNQLVQQLQLFFQRQLDGLNIQLRLQPHHSPVIIYADRLQMEQVFVNVVKNAQEAIDQKGVIEIVTSNISPQLKIRNNGEPIPAQVQPRIFSPFFSTKKDGQGIGLMLTREVLGQHGYDFSLATDTNGWTEFSITTW